MRTRLAALLLLVPSFALAADYKIDSAHSAASFSVRHLMVSNVRGEFKNVNGTISYDEKNLDASKVDATIDVSTVNTGEPPRDGHLKSPDFFDVAKYPTINFKSKQFYKEGGVLKIKGDLTIHGTTKEVVLTVDGPSAEVKDPWGNARFGASATTKINRQDYGVSWSKTLDGGGAVVGDEVSITIDLEATKQAMKK